MTDNEIIKALECCTSWGCETSCADCPLHDTGCLHFNKLGETLDLINRQKATIEQLEKDKESFANSYAKAVARNLTIKAEAVKEFAKKFKKIAIKDKSPMLCIPYYRMSVKTFDNLVEEMVGEN